MAVLLSDLLEFLEPKEWVLTGNTLIYPMKDGQLGYANLTEETAESIREWFFDIPETVH